VHGVELQGNLPPVIHRRIDQRILDEAVEASPVVLLTGSRQVGKTTMARRLVAPGSSNYFDLEDPADAARLAEPMTALRPLTGLVVIDEVQRQPDVFTALRVLVDRQPRPASFLVLGSASPAALRQSSESLTGRIEVIELGGIRISDVAHENLDVRWLRGGYPVAFTAQSDAAALRWLRSYVRNLATRDLPEFGVGLPAAAVERFLALVAHHHGQLWNSATPARALGIAETTVRKYLDVLDDALLARVLLPWHENFAKRQVKSPKVYLRDSGLAHALLGINDQTSLLRHAQAGATWEGFVIEECIRLAPEGFLPYFWRTSAGAELDLLLVRGDQRIGIEVKRQDAPRVTPSMRAALEDLHLDRLTVMYPGTKRYTLADRVDVVPLIELTEYVPSLFV
jgi:uncharacterized protein